MEWVHEQWRNLEKTWVNRKLYNLEGIEEANDRQPKKHASPEEKARKGQSQCCILDYSAREGWFLEWEATALGGFSKLWGMGWGMASPPDTVMRVRVWFLPLLPILPYIFFSDRIHKTIQGDLGIIWSCYKCSLPSPNSQFSLVGNSKIRVNGITRKKEPVSEYVYVHIISITKE